MEGGALPITLSEVVAYLQIHPLVRTVEERLEFLDLIQAMDVVWLGHKAEKVQKAVSQPKPSQSPRPLTKPSRRRT